MFVCMCVCMYLMYVHTYVRVHVCMCACMHECMYACVYVCFLCMFACVCAARGTLHGNLQPQQEFRQLTPAESGARRLSSKERAIIICRMSEKVRRCATSQGMISRCAHVRMYEPNGLACRARVALRLACMPRPARAKPSRCLRSTLAAGPALLRLLLVHAMWRKHTALAVPLGT